MAVYNLIVGTPWWVYLLLVYLLTLGYQATKPRTISIKKIFILPTIFTYMSLYTLHKTLSLNLPSFSTWILALIPGIALGWLQISLYQIQVDRTHKLLRVPGTWSTLTIILTIFTIKYYFTYQLTVHPSLTVKTQFSFCILMISGMCTGLFVGRFLCYLYRFNKEYSVDLKAALTQTSSERSGGKEGDNY